MPYRVKEEYQHIPQLATQINNVSVALNSPYQHKIPAHAGRPERIVQVRLATQDELKKLFEAGSPVIEEYTDTKQEKAGTATA